MPDTENCGLKLRRAWLREVISLGKHGRKGAGHSGPLCYHLTCLLPLSPLDTKGNKVAGGTSV